MRAARHGAVARKLIDCLQTERIALIEGAFPRLEKITSKLDSLTRELEALPPLEDDGFQGQLREIGRLADSNTRLAEASRRGLANGKAKVLEIADVRTRLSTYSNTGSTVDLVPPRLTQDRRT